MLAWIEASIRYSGGFTKNEKAVYRDIFGLSEATVSRHQSEFQLAFEGFCGAEVFERDLTGRVKGGKLVLKSGASLPGEFAFEGIPSIDEWLPKALGNKYVEVPPLRAQPTLWILRILVSAILQKIPVFIAYQSRNRSSERIISPLVIVKIAERCHVRAYDHGLNEARDFVLSRIVHIESRENEIFHDTDPDWEVYSAIAIEEKRSPAGEEDLRGIRADFGLDETGVRVINVRDPLVQYLIDEAGEGFESPVRVRRGS